jgi:hypothetical protein
VVCFGLERLKIDLHLTTTKRQELRATTNNVSFFAFNDNHHVDSDRTIITAAIFRGFVRIKVECKTQLAIPSTRKVAVLFIDDTLGQKEGYYGTECQQTQECIY